MGGAYSPLIKRVFVAVVVVLVVVVVVDILRILFFALDLLFVVVSVVGQLKYSQRSR